MEGAAGMGSRRYCFRPNAIFALKGIKLRAGSMKKEPCGRARTQQEGGLSVTKDRSTKALSPSEVRGEEDKRKKSFVCGLQCQKEPKDYSARHLV